MYTTFNITNESSVVIYGGGEKSIRIKRRLNILGCNVRCFIDQHAEELDSIEGVPVYKPEEKVINLIKDCILIISISDGMKHVKIAHEFFVKGINKIVFLPIGLNCSYKEKYLYRKAYFELENGSGNINCIPLLHSESPDNWIIYCSKQDDIVSFWCCADMLYIVPEYIIRRNLEGKRRDITNVIDYAESSMLHCKPYEELFQYLRCGKGSVETYMKFQGVNNESERRILLCNRKKLYEEYQKALKYDMNFFIQSPARAVWNGKNGFYVLDGCHRSHFLISEGYDRVPIFVSSIDYDSFIKYQRYNFL